MAKYPPIKMRRASERDGILFWILPPLLLGAIFWFCSTNAGEKKSDEQPAAEAAAEE